MRSPLLLLHSKNGKNSMEKHKCKLCYRRFSNGRALGGHMKSHMMHLPLPPKPDPGPSFGSLSSSPSSSFSTESEIVKDKESETESSRNVTRRRSKRTRKPTSTIVKFHHQDYNLTYDDINSCDNYYVDQLPSSSTSVVTSEEDVAFCLMMMSRDTWSDSRIGDRNGYENNEYEYESDNVVDNISPVSQRKKYRCDTCNKVFKSYQALGGHRASHQKTRVSSVESVVAVKEKDEKKIHECPICFRVFPSGQALGGHKRSHVMGSMVNSVQSEVIVRSPKKGSTRNLIDLNLPAPIDDEEEQEIATSAVFDDHL